MSHYLGCSGSASTIAPVIVIAASSQAFTGATVVDMGCRFRWNRQVGAVKQANAEGTQVR